MHRLPMPSWTVWSCCAAFIQTFEMTNFVGYGWEGLPEGSLVVDVGGGVGSQSLTLANNHPQLRFVIQDRESVVGDAIEVCGMDRISTFKNLNMTCVVTADDVCAGHT